MNTRLVIAIFVLLVLAIAGLALTAPTSTEAGLIPANVTVMMKNRDFPLKGRMTMEPCTFEVCADI
jgi:hypothetical protein